MKKILIKHKLIFIALPLVISAAVIFGFVFLNRSPKTDKTAENKAQASAKDFPATDNEINQNSKPLSDDQKNTGSDQTKNQAERPTLSPLNKEVWIGNQQSSKIAITLDAGASATQTPEILAIFKKNNVHCTFFVTGKWALGNPNLIKQMVADGHTLGNHTYSHTDLTTLTDAQILDELSQTEAIIKSIVPSASTKPYFRAPFGARNQHVLDVAASAGYQEIYWTFDALDWQTDATSVKVEQRIYDNVRSGAIILMHVGDDITPEILDRVLHNLKSDGFKPTTLDDLLA